MPDQTITTTPHGWPLLDDYNYISATPAYTRQLAQKLEAGDANPAAAINAATEAKAARDELRAALTQLAKLPAAVAAGTATVSMNGQVTNSASITFPSGRFTTPPLVTATIISAGNWKVVCQARNITATGATLHIAYGDGTNLASTSSVTIHWHAIQMTNTSAAG